MRPRPAILALLALALGSSPTPAWAEPSNPQTFHIMEITQIMAAYNGDPAMQAIEMRMLASGQNLLTGTQLNVYDKDGVLVTTLGTFPSSLANSVVGSRVLATTAAFASAFGIVPDLTIAAGIPTPTGQVVFEITGCRVNSIPYGGIVTRLASASSALALPTLAATALVRTVNDATAPTCPLAEDAGVRFTLRSGSSTAPLVFQNNHGDTTQVYSTVTGVESPPPSVASLKASPNPFRGQTRIDAPDWGSLVIHDVQGRLVRVLTCVPGGACPQLAGAFSGSWDGRDTAGREVPSGVYFLRYEGAGGRAVKAIVYLR